MMLLLMMLMLMLMHMIMILLCLVMIMMMLLLLLLLMLFFLTPVVHQHHLQIAIPQKANIKIDEIKQFTDMRYLSPVEACWRLFGFPTHYLSSTVVRMDIHLKDEQNVTFAEDVNLQLVRIIII